MKKLFITLLLTSLLLQQTVQKSCRAIVFQDGSDFSAFEAGVFQGLISKLPAEEAQYQVVTGVGFGAINAAFLDKYPIGQESKAAADMVKTWSNMDHSDVYHNYIGGLTQSILFENSLYNAQPLRTFIDRNFEGVHNRDIFIGATDVNNGEYVRYDRTITGDDWTYALLSSASVPYLFSYQKFQGRTVVSGNLVHTLDIAKAIQQCMKYVDDESEIIVDTIMTANKYLTTWTGGEKCMDAYNREQKMLEYLTAYRDYIEAKEFYPRVNYRHTIVPSKALPNANFPFAFEHKDLLSMVEQGKQDAAAAVEANSNEGDKIIVKEYYTRLLNFHGVNPTEENIQNHIERQTAKMSAYKAMKAKVMKQRNEQ